jgi:heme/copper-type cytochrome/quinol oxidase subunit 4
MAQKKRICLIILLTNLILGNLLLWLGGSASFAGEVNYYLMLGMSIACVIVYLVVFAFLPLETYGTLHLILLSIACCMLIILIGNTLALALHEPDDFWKHPVAIIFMGLAENLVLLPVSIGMGLLNWLWLRKLNPEAIS